MKKDFSGIVGIVLVGAILLTFSGTVYSFVRGAKAPVSVVKTSAEADGASPARVLVIDPGHGGEDGGAAAADGTKEADIDLAIAKDIDALCLLFGVPSVMTRDSDESLADRFPDDTAGGRKARDLRARLRVAEEADAALLLSVHANKFPDPSVHGIHVFYSPNGEESRAAASLVQEYVNENLQPDNRKESKKANSSIYLLNRAKMPALLAECGFISNGDELDALKTPEYRASVACVIFAAVGEYMNSKG
ncbi:MAG: N-acetylmuramoyl-L-alanine amidase [Clostridia bacterium]|nr:N-acetylmuramoyl-L-alanine amidase [Clostridia bacterium]